MGLILGGLALVVVLAVACPSLYWRYRKPKDIRVVDSLNLELWTAVPPDAHHSNTDLFKFKGQYLLVHATSPWHFASTKCRLVVRSSPDGKNWRVLSRIGVPGEDVRDPKLAFINGALFLYFLRNANKFDPEPVGSSYCISDDAINWTEPKDLSIKGWLIWRPKSIDNVTFYAPAYWWEHGKSMLFKSINGFDWSEVGLIYSGDKNDETDISFRPDGSMIMTARLEMNVNRWGYHPEGHTAIGVSSPPFTKWAINHSCETRLDGPCLFQIGERTYAVGRRHVGGPKHMGSVWGAKRTSLYLVLSDRLVFLSDLPSCGDTTYAGVVVEGEDVLISYYTSPPGRDYIWLMGMLSKSSIEMARLKVKDLEKLADSKLV
jgi:hypothetical protein